jgi:hypothetical protein
MRAKEVFILVFVLLAIGCGPTKHITADDAYTHTTSKYYHYKKSTWINGPTMRVSHATQKLYSTEYSDVFLRTLVVREKIKFQQLYVTFYGLDWVFFNEAYDINGNKLEFVQLDRTFDSPGVVEHFTITFPRGYLESVTKSGINIKCVGKKGERVVTLEPTHIEGYLKKYRELTSTQ